MKYVIDFYNHVDELVINQYLIDNNITKIKQLESFGKVYLVESENEIVITDLIENLSADADQPVNLLSFTIDLVDNYTETSFDIEDEKNWWKVATINKIDFDQPTHTHKIRGTNSTVYIIDSGITVSHPEFATADIELLHTFNGNFTDNNGHGTGLSSLIVGPNCGLANPKLKVVKLFDNTQPTYQSDMLIALDVILNDYITNGKKASVVNMSWSIPKNDYVNNKIQFMINQGMFVVAAAGNSGMPIGDVTPASIPDVLTIGSFNQNLEPSSFSNYTGGSDISYTANDVNSGALDGWAPGELIWAANKNGSYGYIAGTSASAAIVAASFAYNLDMALQDNGQLQNEQVFEKHRLTYFQNLSIARNGILNLSDIKYSESLNKISTFISMPKTSKSIYRITTKAGLTKTFYLFNPLVTARVSFSVLPEYASINDRGFISISYPEINELVEKPNSIDFVVTLRDGTSESGALNLIIWNQTYTSLEDIMSTNTAQLESDFELQYALQYGPGQCFDDGTPGCGENGCSDYSGGAVGCSYFAKGNACCN